MPTSDPSAISTILGAIIFQRPRSVLDVGPGYGKYGMLVREYLGPLLDRVDAAEPWPAGMMPALRAMYNEVYEEEFPGLRAWPAYDLVLMIDVLEHYSELHGHGALEAALDVGTLLVSTPHWPAHQGAVDGNPWEEHRSRWTEAALRVHDDQLVVYPHHGQLIAILSR